MSYRTILVHLADERRLPGLMQLAMPIAVSCHAHLVGLSVLPSLIIVPDMDVAPGTLIEEHRADYRAQMDRMKEAFLAATRLRSIAATWEERDAQSVDPFGNVAGLVAERAGSADLIVVAQPNREWALSSMLDIGEEVAVGCGRPVLFLPRTCTRNGSIKRVLVAWNGSREATRAVFDTLPLMRGAEDVVIAEVRGHEGNTSVGPASADALCVPLRRHDVPARPLGVVAEPFGVGARMLSLADELESDLIVMGCYGHSRLRELILGGVTRHVLDHMSIPVLMSR